MNQEYKCPYCGQGSYAKTSKNTGVFTSWNIVIKHLSKCKQADGSFLIDQLYGPITVEEINNLTVKQLKNKYPSLKISSKKKSLTKCTKVSFNIFWDKDAIITAIHQFYNNYSKIPSVRDFTKENPEYPNHDTVKKYFGTWNAAIIAAGFEPNLQNGFGIDTHGLDRHLYRSKHEAYFADTFLYNKYDYVIEPKYPKPYNRYYDWYIPSLDLYIELDGGCRPDVIQQKRLINDKLERNCLIIKTNDLYNSNFKIPT